MSKPCLHCKIRQTVIQHYLDLGLTFDGKPAINVLEAVSMIVESAAEIIGEVEGLPMQTHLRAFAVESLDAKLDAISTGEARTVAFTPPRPN